MSLGSVSWELHVLNFPTSAESENLEAAKSKILDLKKSEKSSLKIQMTLHKKNFKSFSLNFQNFFLTV